MFCAKCGAKVAEGQSFCPSCGQSATSKAASGEKTVVVVEKKKGKGCLIAVIVLAAIGLISTLVSSKDEEKAMTVSSAVTAEEATSNGEDLVAWIRNRKTMTEIARDDAFAKLKGKTVLLRGKVCEVESAPVSKEMLISIAVGQLNQFERMIVRFKLRKSHTEQAKTWNKDEVHTLRGRVEDQGFLSYDAECDIAEIVE